MVGDVNLFLKGVPPAVGVTADVSPPESGDPHTTTAVGETSDDPPEFEVEAEVMIAGELPKASFRNTIRCCPGVDTWRDYS
jgi:hypothetical protein